MLKSCRFVQYCNFHIFNYCIKITKIHKKLQSATPDDSAQMKQQNDMFLINIIENFDRIEKSIIFAS